MIKLGDTLSQIAKAKGLSEQEILSLNRLKGGLLATNQVLKIPARPSASDLKGFASREWLRGLIDPAHIDTPDYFGNSKLRQGKMVKFVKKDVANFSSKQKQDLAKVVAALSAQAQLKSQRVADKKDASIIAEGTNLLASADMRCTECHQFHSKDEDTTGPDLTSYGSREWLVGLITNPAHERYYGQRNDRMPKFGDDKILDAQAIAMLADWLRGDWEEADKGKEQER